MNDNFPEEDDLSDVIEMLEQHDHELDRLNAIILRQKRTIDALNRLVFTSDRGYCVLSRALQIMTEHLPKTYREKVINIIRDYAAVRPNVVSIAQRITSEPQITPGSRH